MQRAGLGFAMVEILSSCPTNWGLDPVESLGFISKEMTAQYPLGVYRGEEIEVKD